MKRKGLFLLLMLISLIIFSASSVPVAFSQSPEPMLKMVSIDAGSAGAVKKLARMGIDIAAVREGPVVEGDRGVPISDLSRGGGRLFPG